MSSDKTVRPPHPSSQAELMHLSRTPIANSGQSERHLPPESLRLTHSSAQSAKMILSRSTSPATWMPWRLSWQSLCRRGCVALVAGGRLACVIGDVCLSRRQNGRHAVVPLHSAVQERCRAIGFDNLAPIIWYKISNAACEAGNGTTFLGKPYEPNAVIKNDVEYILLLRKARWISAAFAARASRQPDLR